MTLKNRDFIFLDFQTTGTVAARSDIVEAGWGLYRAETMIEKLTWTTHLIALADDRPLSRTIQKLTGLSGDYYQVSPSISAEELKLRLTQFLEDHKTTPIVLHYAQFKVPFLLKVLGEGSDAPDRIICVHRLSKRLVPGLKAYSLRAVAGYLGYATAEKKRSEDHLNATATIWRELSSLIHLDPLADDLVASLKIYAPESGQAAALPIHDQDLRKKRLALPHKPGVYYFLDRFDNVLYVGKAADLHHRVNSYFRGRKTKGSRLNEMLTRAVGFRFVEVGSELEALLLENDEIKRIDPPYNRLLRVEGRSLQNLCFNDLLPEPVSWGHRSYGPFSSLWMIEALKLFMNRGIDLRFAPVYMDGITPELVREAAELLFLSYGLTLHDSPTSSDWYALALKAWPEEHARLWQKQQGAEEEILPADLEGEAELEAEEASDKVWTAEDLEAFLRDACLSLYRQILRSRWFLRLSHCLIEWEFKPAPGHVHHFLIRGGRLESDGRLSDLKRASYRERIAAFDMQVYDRMGILYAEIKKGLKRGDKIRLHLSPSFSLNEEDLRTYVRP